MLPGADVIEHGSSRTGRWLRERRLQFVVGIALAESLVVWLTPHISRWTVVVVAILAIAVYVFAGRSTRSDTGHQVSWIVAASQALAVVLTNILGIVAWLVLAVVIVFAAIALLILLTDR